MGLDRFITIAEAAREFHISTDWVRKLCRRNLIDCRKSGNLWVLDRRSLAEYMGQERHPGPKAGRPPKK